MVRLGQQPLCGIALQELSSLYPADDSSNCRPAATDRTRPHARGGFRLTLEIASHLEFDRAAVRRTLFEKIVPGAVYADFCSALSGSLMQAFTWISSYLLHASLNNGGVQRQMRLPTRVDSRTGATTTGCELLIPHCSGVQSDPCAALT